jgi:flagellar hook-associated protein 2
LAATSTISSAGIGSGLDVNSIVTQLMAVERQPLTKLQTTSATLQTQLSAFGQLKSGISALRDAAAPLYAAASFTQSTAGSSDPNSVSASTSASAIPGSYAVSVGTLSASQSVVSPGAQYTAATDVVGTGALTVRLGTWAANVFTPKAGSVDIAIPIGATENTLAGIRDKINAAASGISATLVTDANGVRIALQSTASGLDNGFRVTVSDDDAGLPTDNVGLSRLAYDNPGSLGQMGLSQAAANTTATINGIPISATSNTLTDVVGGMTFTLSKVTTTPVTVTVTRNTDAIKTQLKAFVTAYNQLNSFLSDATKYDAAAKQGALLQGDSTTVGIQNQLHALLSQTTGASTTYTTLSSIGLQVQKDGTLLMNDTKVTAALANLPELTKALSNVDAAVPSNNGFGKKFAAWSDLLLSTSGAVPGKTKSLQARIDSNKKDQNSLTDRLDAIEKRMRAQYTSLDTTMSNANALSKYVTQQITTWNKSTA